MKKLLLSSLIFFSLKLFSQLPDYSLLDMNNNYTEIKELAGENLTIVDFWATWCKPCLTAIPELVKIQEDYAEQGVQVIGISIDSPRNQSKVLPFAISRGINYPVLLDPDQEAMSDMNAYVVPTMIIYNKEGKVVFSHEGFKPGDEIIVRNKIDQLLKKSSN